MSNLILFASSADEREMSYALPMHLEKVAGHPMEKIRLGYTQHKHSLHEEGQ